MSRFSSVYRLTGIPTPPDRILQLVRHDYDQLANCRAPTPLSSYLRDRYDLDMSTEYAGFPIDNPWGKASGQLSMTAGQVQEDIDAGLGFVVLKTVIAQDQQGIRTMQAWAVKEARMDLQPILGQTGESGWTVSWKGRGWWGTFDEYLALIRSTRRQAGDATLIVPSVKYHLPTPDETIWRTEEYDWSTQMILKAWTEDGSTRWSSMPIEKDFSPTLAGSDRAMAQQKIIEWLTVVPRLIRSAATHCNVSLRVGMKMFNALFDDEFQIEMLNTIHHAQGNERPDYFIYGNRLFDPDRVFDGHRGIAYGGPDLSHRNLRVLDRFHESEKSQPMLPLSATGNISSGRMALEYALRGASSFQLHTFFQHPSDFYRKKTGNRTQKALHELYFHPEDGLIAWMYDLAQRYGLSTTPLRFTDIVGLSDNRSSQRQ
ncbi:MAG: hypothetical protein O3A29_20520 [Planctomycetota bacterium]|nr:hypothetical protein [Planctomycetota bacterium]